MRIRSTVRLADLAGIQYVGSSAWSDGCVQAVRRLVVLPTPPTSARLLSADRTHAFVFFFEAADAVVVKDGFKSGYRGEGPTALADALSVLVAVGIDLDEVEVSDAVMKRLSASALTSADMESVQSADPVRPHRWYDYIAFIHEGKDRTASIWGSFDTIVPLAALDLRLVKLGRRLLDNPDPVLMDGFRMLEDQVRERTGLSESGSKLFAQAFQVSNSKLMWCRAGDASTTEPIDAGEQAGRAQLFIGVYQAFRNPRAHRTLDITAEQALNEFMVLNQLFLLEAQAVERPLAPADDEH